MLVKTGAVDINPWLIETAKFNGRMIKVGPMSADDRLTEL